MTIDDLQDPFAIPLDSAEELPYVAIAKKALQSKISTFVDKVKESYAQFFGDRIPDPEYFQLLKEKITGVQDRFSADLFLDDSRSEVKFYVENYLKELYQLSLDEWPLAYQTAKDQIVKIRNRGVLANEQFPDYFGFDDILAFESYENTAQEALNEARYKLPLLPNFEERNSLIKKTLEAIREVQEDVELHISKFSIPDFKDRILRRIGNITSKFEDFDLSAEEMKVEEIEAETESLLRNKDKKSRMLVVESQVDRLQEVDTEIEKKYSIRLIQHEYEEILRVVMKLQGDGLSLSNEVRYAKERVEGSKERIMGMTSGFSPTSLNPISQLQITKKGTLNTLAHTLKEVYTKYGEHTIKSAIQLLPFCSRLGGFDGIGYEEKEALAMHRDQLVEQAKENLTWGDKAKKANVPPILSEEQIEEIIDKHLGQAFISIYLAYAEQRIRKYLKFWLLRKSFEGFSKEQEESISQKTNDLIQNLKKELSSYLNEQTPPRVSIKNGNAQITGEFRVDELKVETIICSYIQRLNDICTEK